MLDQWLATRDGVCLVKAATERTDGRGTSSTRGLEVHALLNCIQQIEDSVGVTGQLDPHGVAAFLVHDGEELPLLAVQVSCHVDGSQTASLAEVIPALFESGGALGAAGSVTLELVEDELLVVVNITHDEGTWNDLNGSGHGVGAAKAGGTP